MGGSQQLAITPVRGCDELASALALEARRRGLLTVLNWMGTTLTITRLRALLKSRYADELAEITVEQLTEPVPRSFLLRHDEAIEDAIMRVFEWLPDAQLSSGFFIRHMGLERWTAQRVLAELAMCGWLVRGGKTSATTYCLAPWLMLESTDDE